jgi:hypothetical protein
MSRALSDFCVSVGVEERLGRRPSLRRRRRSRSARFNFGKLEDHTARFCSRGILGWSYCQMLVTLRGSLGELGLVILGAVPLGDGW